MRLEKFCCHLNIILNYVASQPYSFKILSYKISFLTVHKVLKRPAKKEPNKILSKSKNNFFIFLSFLSICFKTLKFWINWKSKKKNSFKINQTIFDTLVINNNGVAKILLQDVNQSLSCFCPTKNQSVSLPWYLFKQRISTAVYLWFILFNR